MARPYRWKWTAPIQRETLGTLQDLAVMLGFLSTAPGQYQGRPAPADMLDALAAAYRADPGGTHLALKVILDANGLRPSTPTPADADAGEGG